MVIFDSNIFDLNIFDTGAAEPSTGVLISGTHARPFLVLPRRKQTYPVMFNFHTKSIVLTETKPLNIEFKSKLLKSTENIIKLKSTVLSKIKTHFHLKSGLLEKTNPLIYRIVEKKKFLTIILNSKESVKTIKNVLLERLESLNKLDEDSMGLFKEVLKKLRKI